MIYYLAALPCGIFQSIKTIFNLYSKGGLKGQKVSRSKAKAHKDIDLKGSVPLNAFEVYQWRV